MENRLNKAFKKEGKALNLYFTAGYPELNDTTKILKIIEESGVDMVEIGMPFSDPLADGPTIQQSSGIALDNGMSLKVLFEQLKAIRESIDLPIILMGYINPIMQFGMENFIHSCDEVGIDGLILPDLPLDIYESNYKDLFEKNGIANIFLVTPQTSEERIKHIDHLSSSFIYLVSTASTTGSKDSQVANSKSYFERIKAMNLKSKTLIGFNVKDQASYEFACQYADGAIIGSAFVKGISQTGSLESNITSFIKSIR